MTSLFRLTIFVSLVTVLSAASEKSDLEKALLDFVSSRSYDFRRAWEMIHPAKEQGLTMAQRNASYLKIRDGHEFTYGVQTDIKYVHQIYMQILKVQDPVKDVYRTIPIGAITTTTSASRPIANLETGKIYKDGKVVQVAKDCLNEIFGPEALKFTASLGELVAAAKEKLSKL